MIQKTTVRSMPHRTYVPEFDRELLRAFGIADDILIKGHDHHIANYDRTLHRVLQISKKENLKLQKMQF